MTTITNINPRDLWEDISSVRTEDDAQKTYIRIKLNREVSEKVREDMIDSLVFGMMIKTA